MEPLTRFQQRMRTKPPLTPLMSLNPPSNLRETKARSGRLQAKTARSSLRQTHNPFKLCLLSMVNARFILERTQSATNADIITPQTLIVESVTSVAGMGISRHTVVSPHRPTKTKLFWLQIKSLLCEHVSRVVIPTIWPMCVLNDINHNSLDSNYHRHNPRNNNNRFKNPLGVELSSSPQLRLKMQTTSSLVRFSLTMSMLHAYLILVPIKVLCR